MRNKAKKKLPLLLSVLLVLLCLGGIAYAQWSVRNVTRNEITTASVRGEIKEVYTPGQEVNPGMSADKEVKVENTGSIDSLVRVRVTKYWGKSRDAFGKLIEEPGMSTDNIEIQYDSTSWERIENEAGEEWFYYKDILEPGAISNPLFKTFKISESTGNEYQGMEADIRIRMECIQAGASEAAYWGTSLEDLGITYARSQEINLITGVKFVDPETGFVFNADVEGMTDDGDLFTNFKDLVPGESRTQTIEISSQWQEEKVRIFFGAEVNDQAHATEETEALIRDMLRKYVEIRITNNAAQTIYDGHVWGNLSEEYSGSQTMQNLIPLGVFEADTKENLLVTLQADKDMDNDYQELSGLVNWVFVAQDMSAPIDPVKAVEDAEGGKVNAGDRLTYKIEYYNHENEPVDVLITDDLDRNVKLISADEPYSYDAKSHQIQWLIAAAPASDFGSVEMIVEVLPGVWKGNDDGKIQVENQADVKIGNNSSVETNKVVTPVEPETEDPQKSIKNDDGEAAYPEDEVTFTIAYFNPYDKPVKVEITDGLDKNVSYKTSNPEGTYSKDNHEVTWVIADAEPGWGSVDVTVVVGEEAVKAQKIFNQAGVSVNNNPFVKTNQVEKPVEPKPDPEDPQNPRKSIKDDDGEPAHTGDEVVYRIQYYNHNEEPVDVIIEDILDPNVTYKDSTPEGNFDGDRTVTWTIKNAEPFAWGEVELTVAVNEDAVSAGKIENTAGAKIGNDPYVNTKKVEKKVDPEPDPEPEKPKKSIRNDDGEAAYPEDEVTFTIAYFNPYDEPVEVEITDSLDRNVRYKTSSPEGTYNREDHEVTWVIADAERGWGSVDVTVVVGEEAVKAQKIFNQADVSVNNNPSVKTNQVEKPVEPTPDPEEPQIPRKSIKDDDGQAVYAGDEVVYRIQYYNHNEEPVDVMIEDTLDPNVTYKNSTPEGSFDRQHTITWTIENAEPFTWGEVELTVTVNEDAVAAGKIENTASAKIGNDPFVSTRKVEKKVDFEPDPNPEPDDPRKPEKALVENNGTTAVPGDEITFRITYYNHEIEPMDVTIEDYLDVNTSFAAASHGGDYNQEEHLVTWKIENVPAKTQGSVTVTVKIEESALKYNKVDNTAWAAIGNNNAVETNKVTKPVTKEPEPIIPEEPVDPEKTITKAPKGKAKTGDEISYEIIFYNHENEAVDVIVTDELDPNVIFKSAEPEGIYDEETHTVNWKIGNADPESYGNVQVTVEILNSAYEAGSVENEAEVKIGNHSFVKTNKVTTPVKEEQGEPTPDPEPGTNPKDPVGIGSRSKNFKKTPMNDKAAAGAKIDYVFSDFDNEIGRTMKRYSITDIFPEGLLFESASVPAFVKGEGLTYTVSYITNQQKRRILHEDVAADKSFVFTAPTLESGEWIMYLTIAFDEVPAGFGAGDTITFTCRVADDVKEGTTLVNEAALGYDGENIAGETKGVKINNKSGIRSLVRTGDAGDYAAYLALAGAALFAVFVLYVLKKQEKTRRK